MPNQHTTLFNPIVIDVHAGKSYWWCACGKSATQPFCDGSHQGTDFSPVKFEAKRNDRLWFCTCKHSKQRPLCDGSHNQLNR